MTKPAICLLWRRKLFAALSIRHARVKSLTSITVYSLKVPWLFHHGWTPPQDVATNLALSTTTNTMMGKSYMAIMVKEKVWRHIKRGLIEGYATGNRGRTYYSLREVVKTIASFSRVAQHTRLDPTGNTNRFHWIPPFLVVEDLKLSQSYYITCLTRVIT